MARYVDRLTRKVIVAHLADGTSIQGVLLGAYRDSIVLAHAEVLGDVKVPIDGEAVLPRKGLSWIQNLPTEV